MPKKKKVGQIRGLNTDEALCDLHMSTWETKHVNICTCSAGTAVQYQRRTVLRTLLMFLRTQNWHTKCAGVFLCTYMERAVREGKWKEWERGVWCAQWGRECIRSGGKGQWSRTQQPPDSELYQLQLSPCASVHPQKLICSNLWNPNWLFCSHECTTDL